MPNENAATDPLDAYMASKGVTPSELMRLVDAMAAIKQREQTQQQAAANAAEDAKKAKVVTQKEFVFPSRKDVWIYIDGRTKSGTYYLAISNRERFGKKITLALGTTDRITALATAEKIYAEHHDRLRRGVKPKSLKTKDLFDAYLQTRARDITTVPHEGITQNSYDNLEKMLRYWLRFIGQKRLQNRNIEDINPAIGKEFKYWIFDQPKERYTDRERSKETVNQIVSAVKRMYKDYALEENFITPTEIPKFDYFKKSRDTEHKRDILLPEEFQKLKDWIKSAYIRDDTINDLERLKRKVFYKYLEIQYLGGFRNKECLGIRWCDVVTIPNGSELDKRINRAIFIPAKNSKTGKSRHCVCPVAYQFEQIRMLYKDEGIEMNRNDFVFINLVKSKRGKNIPYNQPAMEKRLYAVLEKSGLQKILDNTGREITQYSARHYAITDARMRGVNIDDIAINTGTSRQYIESTYSKVNALMKTKELSKGQEYQQIAEKYNIKEDDCENLELVDGGFRIGDTEYNKGGAEFSPKLIPSYEKAKGTGAPWEQFIAHILMGNGFSEEDADYWIDEWRFNKFDFGTIEQLEAMYPG